MVSHVVKIEFAWKSTCHSSTCIEETSSDGEVKKYEDDTNQGSADSNTSEENSDNYEVIWSCNYNNNANKINAEKSDADSNGDHSYDDFERSDIEVINQSYDDEYVSEGTDDEDNM